MVMNGNVLALVVIFLVRFPADSESANFDRRLLGEDAL
jgi:hypothetical protein